MAAEVADDDANVAVAAMVAQFGTLTVDEQAQVVTALGLSKRDNSIGLLYAYELPLDVVSSRGVPTDWRVVKVGMAARGNGAARVRAEAQALHVKTDLRAARLLYGAKHRARLVGATNKAFDARTNADFERWAPSHADECSALVCLRTVPAADGHGPANGARRVRAEEVLLRGMIGVEIGQARATRPYLDDNTVIDLTVPDWDAFLSTPCPPDQRPVDGQAPLGLRPEGSALGIGPSEFVLCHVDDVARVRRRFFAGELGADALSAPGFFAAVAAQQRIAPGARICIKKWDHDPGLDLYL